MTWNNDWPVIGEDPDGDGKGQPVLVHKKPNVGKAYPKALPQTSDDFDTAKLGLQWQWNANFKPDWYSAWQRSGFLRLDAIPMPENAPNLLKVPSILLQKLPAPDFSATAKLDLALLQPGDRTGLIILGREYSFIGVEKTTLPVSALSNPLAMKKAKKLLKTRLRVAPLPSSFASQFAPKRSALSATAPTALTSKILANHSLLTPAAGLVPVWVSSVPPPKTPKTPAMLILITFTSNKTYAQFFVILSCLCDFVVTPPPAFTCCCQMPMMLLRRRNQGLCS